MDKAFLKEITILYVEDDELIKKELYDTLKLFFKDVLLASDGEEAIIAYEENIQEIQLIISDINMPYKDGIEVLNEIRKTNKTIPFIFTTAYTSQEYLLSSIKYGVDDYFVKPLNIKQLVEKAEFLIKKNIKKDRVNHYQNMINDYLDTINQVAFVFVFNDDKKIRYVNDFYKELSKLDSSEVIDKDIEFLYHKETSSQLIHDQWRTISIGNKWKGSMKFMTKDDNAFYSNCTIIPVLDEGKTKYISINFITTKEENIRRSFKKKVLYNFNETKKIYKVAQEKIDSLSCELKEYEDLEKKEKEIQNIKELNDNYIKNIDKLEDKLKDIRQRQETFTHEVNVKMKDILESTKELRTENKKSDKKINYLKKEIKVRQNYILRIQEELEVKKRKVNDLEDVLRHRENQIEEKEKLNRRK